MTSEELRKTLRDITVMYFAGANVVWIAGNYTKVSRPFVALKLRTAIKTTHPIIKVKDGKPYRSYPSQARFEVQLFTKGRKKSVKEGYTDVYDNTAVADLEDFCNFIESVKVSYICDEKNISILQNGDVTDVTALLDGVDYEYRAMVEFTVDYMQEVSGGYNLGITQSGGEVAEAFETTPSGGRTEEQVQSEEGYFIEVETEDDGDDVLFTDKDE